MPRDSRRISGISGAAPVVIGRLVIVIKRIGKCQHNQRIELVRVQLPHKAAQARRKFIPARFLLNLAPGLLIANPGDAGLSDQGEDIGRPVLGEMGDDAKRRILPWRVGHGKDRHGGLQLRGGIAVQGNVQLEIAQRANLGMKHRGAGGENRITGCHVIAEKVACPPMSAAGIGVHGKSERLTLRENISQGRRTDIRGSGQGWRAER